MINKNIFRSLLVVIVLVVLSLTVYAFASHSTTNETSINDGLQYLKNNPHLKDNGFEIKEEKNSVKYSEEEAISIAKKAIGDDLYNDSIKDKVKITSALVKFNSSIVLPEKRDNATINNVSTWIVTFHGVELLKHGEVISADMNVVIDANSGDELLIFSHEKI